MATLGLLICTFDSDFRKVGQFTTLEKYQVLGTIFFSSATIIFFRFADLYCYMPRKWKSGAGSIYNVQCASRNMMKQRVSYLWEFIILFI